MNTILVHFECEIAPYSGPKIDIPLNSQGQYNVPDLPKLRKEIQAKIIKKGCDRCPDTITCYIREFCQGLL